jgi:hypothetical protein
MRVLDWSVREEALEPAGLVAAGGSVARAVLATLRAGDTARLRSLSAVATRDMLVLLGPATALPWVDGVRYCAPDPCAPGLWLPTHLAPGLPPDLVQSNLMRRTGGGPLLLWHEPEQVLPLDGALALNGPVLDWLAVETG